MSFYAQRKPAHTPAAPPPKALLGAQLVAKCRKCSAVTTHVVRAKLGVKPTRVQCLACNDEHAYATPAVRRGLAAPPRELSWAEAIARTPGLATPYSIVATYAVGARLHHASFGEGVVLRLSSSTVCEVLFEARTVKLVMAATKSEFIAPESRPTIGRRRPRFS